MQLLSSLYAACPVFGLKPTALAVAIVLASGCGGESARVTSVDSTDVDELNIGQALGESETADHEMPPSELLTGIILDSPVGNIRYETPSVSGKTSGGGEFQFKPGEHVTFAIGDIVLPSVVAKETITPLDIFRTENIRNAEVVNLSRLLQTLDTDNSAENGILLPEFTDSLVFNQNVLDGDSKEFEGAVVYALEQAGSNKTLVDSGVAITHLANTLLSRGLIELAQIDPALEIDPSQSLIHLIDLDVDGVADIFDEDDDGDSVADSVDQFPRNASEQLDSDGDGIGNNADNDDDNDGVVDQSDTFPLDPTEKIDTDDDGLGDSTDKDDDGDLVLDIDDAFPLLANESKDVDGDGVGDNADLDDDNDGVSDLDDHFPTDPLEQSDLDGDGIGNNADEDDDNDNIADVYDLFPNDAKEQFDADGDGIGDNADLDDDNDGTSDIDDHFPTDPLEHSDLDGDGIGNNADEDDDNDSIADIDDQFPNDATEQSDADGDGVGDNADLDDDNDGAVDLDDLYPNDPLEHSDSDGDGIGNNADEDDDNDSIADIDDLFPNDATEQSDADGDGIGDNADLDDDNDGAADLDDLYPNDPLEHSDSDGDGIGDNADSDDDNDGVLDVDDAFPLDPAETSDLDADGIGDNVDDDGDNDGISDDQDAFPLDATEFEDSDGDGIGNNADSDDDNDQVPDDEDAFPMDASESSDTDSDGIGDNADTDRDNDGVENPLDAFPNDASEQFDTDGDSYGDNEDPDDDNDTVWDWEDSFPKDPSESKDTDQDGIGNNADDDNDNDGIVDDNDSAPLNSHCATVADSLTEFCDTSLVDEIAFVEKMGDNLFLFMSDSTTAYQLNLSTDTLLTSIDFSEHADVGGTATAAEYHPVHDRLYVALANRDIVYFNVGSTQSTYFYSASRNIQSMIAAGNLLVGAQKVFGGEGIRDDGGDAAIVLKGSGLLLYTQPWGLDYLNLAVWNTADQHLYAEPTYSRLQRLAVDQNTGVVSANKYTGRKSIRSPFVFSPNNDQIVTIGGRKYSTTETELIENQVFSTNGFTNLIWPDAEELVTIRSSGDDTIVERWSGDASGDLELSESKIFEGKPLQIYYENSIFYVITGSSDRGVAINEFTSNNGR